MIIKALILATILFVIYKVNWTHFWWFLNDRCSKCGGEIWEWSSNKAYCRDCGARN